MVVDPSANQPNEALGLGEDDAIDGSLPTQLSDQPGVGPASSLRTMARQLMLVPANPCSSRVLLSGNL